ncbi:hypothetical protein V9L16_22725 [Pseudomonas tolaasii]|uniref:hypothetical protein n=1 Tax=Pseudomonas tolaasii TaxID=29442 RepID=UPI0030CF2642
MINAKALFSVCHESGWRCVHLFLQSRKQDFYLTMEQGSTGNFHLFIKAADAPRLSAFFYGFSSGVRGEVETCPLHLEPAITGKKQKAWRNPSAHPLRNPHFLAVHFCPFPDGETGPAWLGLAGLVGQPSKAGVSIFRVIHWWL